MNLKVVNVKNIQKNIKDSMEKEFELILGLISFGLMIVAFFYRNKLGHFKKYGYLGIFVISAIGNIAIMSPAAPMIAGIGATVYHPVVSSFITTLGAVTGELLSYFIGKASHNYIPKSKWNTKINEFMKINGSLTIFILAIIPNPFFDIAGITAGATKFPFWKFIVFSFFGKWIKFTIFAFMGKKINTMLT